MARWGGKAEDPDQHPGRRPTYGEGGDEDGKVGHGGNFEGADKGAAGRTEHEDQAERPQTVHRAAQERHQGATERQG